MAEAPRKYVAYYRVSTARQGKSGLGIAAQQAAVRSYLSGGAPILEFTEIETGKRSDRPELCAALAACRVRNAVLIIAKLDRLARNVAFLSSLMEAGVEFVAVDHPAANRLTIHIVAAVAENECRLISDRTRAALAAAKARGAVLGGFRGRAGTTADLAKARAARTRQANQRAKDLGPVIADIRACAGNSLRAIAHGLNARGIATARGGLWSANQVRHLIARQL